MTDLLNIKLTVVISSILIGSCKRIRSAECSRGVSTVEGAAAMGLDRRFWCPQHQHHKASSDLSSPLFPQKSAYSNRVTPNIVLGQ